MSHIRSVRGFDDAITARFCGFRDAADYYAQSSANRIIAHIRRPTLIVTAQDDPVVPFAAFEHPAIRENPFITLLAPKHGGHCAFISKELGRGKILVGSADCGILCRSGGDERHEECCREGYRFASISQVVLNPFQKHRDALPHTDAH